MSSQDDDGREWLLPVQARDIVVLSQELMSYEVAGMLFLAPVGEPPAEPDMSQGASGVPV